MTEPGILFFPPAEVVQAIFQQPVKPAAGTCGFLVAAMGILHDPLLVNPPFALRTEG
jgi:hypothetical protein